MTRFALESFRRFRAFAERVEQFTECAEKALPGGVARDEARRLHEEAAQLAAETKLFLESARAFGEGVRT